MNYAEARPSRRLASFIKCFWTLEYSGSSTSDAPAEPVLPDGCPEIVFNLSDRFLRLHTRHEELQPTALFVGQMRSSISIKPTGNVSLFGVRFQPAGAYPLVRFPLSELTDQIIDFSLASPLIGKEVENKISDAGSFAERVAIFEAFFFEQLASISECDVIASNACAKIISGHGLDSISQVANELGVSERRLERRFRQSVGVSPKTFSRIVRFQTVLNAVQGSTSANLLDTALSFGYYDQSHVIRDFKEFSGVTPMTFFERTHQISDNFTGHTGVTDSYNTLPGRSA